MMESDNDSGYDHEEAIRRRHMSVFFKKDDFVYLRLQQRTDPGYKLSTRHVTKKLTQRHIKFKVLERVGRLAYRLQMPLSSRSLDAPLWTTKPRIFCHVRLKPRCP